MKRDDRLIRLAGYTLFELIVAVGIITLVFSLAIASYNSFNKKERLRQTILTLKSNLRFAQTKAFSSEKPTTGCTTFTGMRVNFTQSTYTVAHMCTEGLVGESISVTLPTEITFSPVPTSFTFLALSRQTTIPAGQSLSLTNGSLTYTLSMSGTGDIAESE